MTQVLPHLVPVLPPPLSRFYPPPCPGFTPLFVFILHFLPIFLQIYYKFAHFVVCYIKHLELTLYIGFRPMESFFGKKIFFFVIFWLFWPFLHTKIEVSQNSQEQIGSFCSYRKHLELTLYIGFRPLESFFW